MTNDNSSSDHEKMQEEPKKKHKVFTKNTADRQRVFDKNGKRVYDFEQMRLIVTNYKNAKQTKIQKVQVEGRDQSVTFLTKGGGRKKLSEYKQEAVDKLAATYLPADYPHSVTKEYMPYTMYSSAGSVCGMAMNFLST